MLSVRISNIKISGAIPTRSLNKAMFGFLGINIRSGLQFVFKIPFLTKKCRKMGYFSFMK
jgi:hypothetical protein